MTHLMYPEGRDDHRIARAICATCPVVEPCLQYALEHWERHGCWGAMTEKERRKERQRRRTDKKS